MNKRLLFLLSYVFASYALAILGGITAMIWPSANMPVRAILVAPVLIPTVLVSGFADLIQYGNKSGENRIVLVALVFFLFWSIGFAILQVRAKRRRPT